MKENCNSCKKKKAQKKTSAFILCQANHWISPDDFEIVRCPDYEKGKPDWDAEEILRQAG